jgi:hypothetical protein
MRLKCLSIQQPWADLIMSGRKQVENRSWAWLKDRDWRREGSVLLGIHARLPRCSFLARGIDQLINEGYA